MIKFYITLLCPNIELVHVDVAILMSVFVVNTRLQLEYNTLIASIMEVPAEVLRGVFTITSTMGQRFLFSHMFL